MASGLDLVVTTDSGTATIQLRGELDLATVGSLLACVAQLDTTTRTVRLDVFDLGFLDSMGLSCLLGLHQQLDLDLKVLEIVNLDGQPLRVLEMTGLKEQLQLG